MRGEYQHSIDAKGRLIFPVKLREELGDTFVICKGMDGCIEVQSQEDWAAFEAKIAALPSEFRNLQRFYSANFICEADPQGRVLIPPTLRSYAELTKDVIIVGIQSKAEIWDLDKWNAYNNQQSSDDIAKQRKELGI